MIDPSCRIVSVHVVLFSFATVFLVIVPSASGVGAAPHFMPTILPAVKGSMLDNVPPSLQLSDAVVEAGTKRIPSDAWSSFVTPGMA